jgi:hypothetical protein
MKKVVWISFFIAFVVVNALAMLADYVGDVYIALPYRLAVVLAITMITSVFTSAWMLINKADEEVPITRHTPTKPTTKPVDHDST